MSSLYSAGASAVDLSQIGSGWPHPHQVGFIKLSFQAEESECRLALSAFSVVQKLPIFSTCLRHIPSPRACGPGFNGTLDECLVTTGFS